jgi:hypothetical protein
MLEFVAELRVDEIVEFSELVAEEAAEVPREDGAAREVLARDAGGSGRGDFWWILYLRMAPAIFFSPAKSTCEGGPIRNCNTSSLMLSVYTNSSNLYIIIQGSRKCV